MPPIVVTLLILVVIIIIFGLLYWGISRLPLPNPFSVIAQVLLLIIFVVLVVYYVLVPLIHQLR